MSTTKIEWATDVWNPVTGCSKVSEGCRNCYADRMAKRLAGQYGYPADEPFRVTVHPELLDKPLGWRKPRRVFVCSMGDLFHRAVPFDFIDKVFTVMVNAPRHTFIILTKRPHDMMVYMIAAADRLRYVGVNAPELLPNVCMGVSVEDQATADERIPILLSVPAVVRFVSYEPALGPVDFEHIQTSEVEINALNGDHGVTRPLAGRSDVHLSWVIAGGETGPGARPAHPDWFRSARDQCQAAGVPFFFKQWGEWHFFEDQGRRRRRRCGKKVAGRLLDGRTWDEFPEVLR